MDLSAHCTQLLSNNFSIKMIYYVENCYWTRQQIKKWGRAPRSRTKLRLSATPLPFSIVPSQKMYQPFINLLSSVEIAIVILVWHYNAAHVYTFLFLNKKGQGYEGKAGRRLNDLHYNNTRNVFTAVRLPDWSKRQALPIPVVHSSTNGINWFRKGDHPIGKSQRMKVSNTFLASIQELMVKN